MRLLERFELHQRALADLAFFPSKVYPMRVAFPRDLSDASKNTQAFNKILSKSTPTFSSSCGGKIYLPIRSNCNGKYLLQVFTV